MRTVDCKFLLEMIDYLPKTRETEDARKVLDSEIRKNESQYEFRTPKHPTLKRRINAVIREHAEGRERKRKNDNPDLWQDQFFADMEQCGVIAVAAERSGVSAQKIHHLRSSSAEFAAKFDQAKEAFNDRVEYAAIRRAIDGTVVKKFYKDEPLLDPETGKQYTERQYSDSLLIKLLKARS